MIIFSEIYVNCRIYFYGTFGVYMYKSAASQKTTTAKLPPFFQRFQIEGHVLNVKSLKFFRILVILWGLSTTFWNIAHFINQSLVSLFQALAGYTCWKDSSLKFW